MSSQISQNQVLTQNIDLHESDIVGTRVRIYDKVKEVDAKGFIGDMDMIWWDLEEAVEMLDKAVDAMEIKKLGDYKTVNEAIERLRYIQSTIDAIADVFYLSLNEREREEMKKANWIDGYWINVDKIPRKILCKYLRCLNKVYNAIGYWLDKLNKVWDEIEDIVMSSDNDSLLEDISLMEEALNRIAGTYYELEIICNMARIIDP